MNNHVIHGCATWIIAAYLWLKYLAMDVYIHMKCKSGYYTDALFINYGIVLTLKRPTGASEAQVPV